MKTLSIKLLFLATLLCTTMPATAAETTLQAQTSQPLPATLHLSASPLKSMTEIPFRFELEDADLVIRSAECDLTMPAMPMPENKPEIECLANSCSGTAVFTMAGTWRVTFDLSLENNARTSIVFDIDMVEMK